MADFDNDHQMDIAVSNSGQHSIEILTGYHNGIFKNKMTRPIGDHWYPRGVVVGDFDRNHQFDIAIVNYLENALMIVLNPMNETSTESFVYSTGIESLSNGISTGDINKDGWTDIVMTNSKSDSVSVFLGYAYPVFIVDHTVQFPSEGRPYLVSIADFNGDSIWDLAVVDDKRHYLEILLGNGNGTFRLQSLNVVCKYGDIRTFAIGDFNNDNKSDVAVACSSSKSISILLGDGDGTFPRQISESTDIYAPEFIVVGDFNHDGALDLVLANQLYWSIGVFLGYGNGSLREPVFYQTPIQSAPVWIAVDDLNNDNIVDLAVADTDGHCIRIYFGIGDGTFTNLTVYSTGIRSTPCSVVIADFDEDNCRDVAVLNCGAKNIAIFFGFGHGTFSAPVTYALKGNSALSSMVIEDVNNDTILDIAVASFTDGNANIDVLYGLGRRRFLLPNTYSSSYHTDIVSMVVKDLNNDGRIDFVIIAWRIDKIIIMSSDRVEPFGSSQTISMGNSSNPSIVAVSELNNDDQLDIAVVNSKTSDINILFGDGKGYFMNGMSYSTGVNAMPNSIVIGDVDGDKQNDILVTNSNRNEIGIFFSYGNGTFGEIQTYETSPGSEPSSISIADLDGDSLMDIVVANTGISTVVIFYGTGNRTFLKRKSYSLGYNYRPISVVIGDVNNDGWLDIGVANYESGIVDVLLHICDLSLHA